MASPTSFHLPSGTHFAGNSGHPRPVSVLGAASADLLLSLTQGTHQPILHEGIKWGCCRSKGLKLSTSMQASMQNVKWPATLSSYLIPQFAGMHYQGSLPSNLQQGTNSDATVEKAAPPQGKAHSGEFEASMQNLAPTTQCNGMAKRMLVLLMILYQHPTGHRPSQCRIARARTPHPTLRVNASHTFTSG